MGKKWKTIILALVVLAGCASLAAAESALDMTGVTLRPGYELNNYPGESVGWEFTPKQNLVVTKLGCYSLYSTRYYDHTITIYNPTNMEGPEVVVSAVVGQDSVTLEDGGYAYVDVSGLNVQLDKDQTYVIASYWIRTGSLWDWDIQQVAGYSVAEEFITLGEVDLKGPGPGMPPDWGNTWNTFLSPNFQFTTGPTNPHFSQH